MTGSEEKDDIQPTVFFVFLAAESFLDATRFKGWRLCKYGDQNSTTPLK